MERARHTRPDFSLNDERRGVMRICRLVEGNPLALELAASWTRTASCRDIADEIERNINFLSTSLRDVPVRHRSMEAVFEQSWRLLTDEERNTYKQLSLFKGSFDRAAARAVAGASLPILSALVDKSLVRREGESRYQTHELVRQYAAEKLQASPEEVRGARDRHGTYFLDFLAERAAAMSGGRQRAATAAIEAELANVRTAWGYAVEEGLVQENHSAFDTLYHFYQFQSRYSEGANAFAKAIRSLESQPTTSEKETV